ncbi:hypothetical protein D3C81_1770480 [compost metagenome]
MYHESVSDDGNVRTFFYNVSFTQFHSVLTFRNFSTECMVKVKVFHVEYWVIIANSGNHKTFCIIRVGRDY